MANQESTEYAAAYTTKSKLGPESRDGKERRIFASATLSSELAIGETIKFAKLPANAVITEAKLSCDAGAGLGVLDLGWAAGTEGLEAASVDGLLSGATEVSILSQDMASVVAAPAAGFQKKFTESVDIQLEATTATTASAAGKKYQLELRYILE